MGYFLSLSRFLRVCKAVRSPMRAKGGSHCPDSLLDIDGPSPMDPTSKIATTTTSLSDAHRIRSPNISSNYYLFFSSSLFCYRLVLSFFLYYFTIANERVQQFMLYQSPLKHEHQTIAPGRTARPSPPTQPITFFFPSPLPERTIPCIAFPSRHVCSRMFSNKAKDDGGGK